MRRLKSIRLGQDAYYQSLQVLLSNAVSGIHITQWRSLYLLTHISQPLNSPPHAFAEILGETKPV